MPDLRTVLTETLDQHIGYLYGDTTADSATDGQVGGCTGCDWRGGGADHTAHLADVLLSLPGVAVTQLPEAQADPEYGDPYWPVELEGETYPGKLRIDYGYRSGPRIALIGIPTPLRVADVPNLTAALLSAAAAVVLSEGETR